MERALIAFRFDKSCVGGDGGVTHSALQFWKDTLAAKAASLLLFMTSLRHMCSHDQIFHGKTAILINVVDYELELKKLPEIMSYCHIV